MLRRLIVNKSIVRSFASMKKHNKNEIYEILYFNACFGGGVGGGVLLSYLTYKDKYDSGFVTCVSETTLMGLGGFCLGFTFTFLSPIIVPFGMVVGMIRYLDTKNNKDSKK
jgi:hypothetical protein